MILAISIFPLLVFNPVSLLLFRDLLDGARQIVFSVSLLLLLSKSLAAGFGRLERDGFSEEHGELWWSLHFFPAQDSRVWATNGRLDIDMSHTLA